MTGRRPSTCSSGTARSALRAVECDPDGVPDDGFRAVWRARKQLQADDPLPDHEPEQTSIYDEGEEVTP
jgi:hypothetical protein